MENEKDSVKILEAIQGLSSQVGGLSSRVDGLSSRMDDFSDRMDGFDNRMDGFAEGQKEMKGSIQSLEQGQQEIHEMIQVFSTHVDRRFDSLEGRVGKVEATMVTKDYLDDKLAEHGSRYGELIRKTNGKIEMLTDALVVEKSLSSPSAKRVVSAEPFGR